MALEIEYKFLVKDDRWRAQAVSETRIEQGYLAYAPDEVRVRLMDGNRATLTVKGPKQPDGLTRTEDEVAIPIAAARALLDRSLATLVKTRFEVPGRGVTWEVDVYEGRLKGLVVAAAEVPSVETVFQIEPWIGTDVSSDKAYSNARLAQSGGIFELLQVREAALTQAFRRLGGQAQEVEGRPTSWRMPSGQIYVTLDPPGGAHAGACCERVGRSSGAILTYPTRQIWYRITWGCPCVKPKNGWPIPAMELR